MAILVFEYIWGCRNRVLGIYIMYIAKAETPMYWFCKTHLLVFQDLGFGVCKTRVSESVRPRSYGCHTLWPELQDLGLGGLRPYGWNSKTLWFLM